MIPPLFYSFTSAISLTTVDSRKKRRSPTAPVYRTVYQWSPRAGEGAQQHRRVHSAAANVSHDIHLISVGLRDSSNGQQNVVHRPNQAIHQQPVKLPSVSPPPLAEQEIKIELSCRAKLSNSRDQQGVKLPVLPTEKDPVTTVESHSQP